MVLLILKYFILLNDPAVLQPDSAVLQLGEKLQKC